MTDSKDIYGSEIGDGVAARRMRTAEGNVSMPPEVFEKLYLQPKTNVHGDLRQILGNPTPLYVLHHKRHLSGADGRLY